MRISTRKELKRVLEKDILQNKDLIGRNMLVEFFKGNYKVFLKYRFLVALRKMEYWQNNRKGIKKIGWLFYKHYFQRLQVKSQLFLFPNVFDEGLNIEHVGFAWIDESSQIGKNCTVLPRVLLGKKKPGLSVPNIKIGDNCYIGTGSTILGPVNIGNNVTIAAGAVVIRDVPDNCLVAGNPAQIKKFFNEVG